MTYAYNDVATPLRKQQRPTTEDHQDQRPVVILSEGTSEEATHLEKRRE